MTVVRFLFVLAMLGAQGVVAAADEPSRPELRQRAEDLAGAASQRFTDVLDAEHKAPAAAPQVLTARDTQKSAAGRLDPVWDWLTRSAQSYDEIVVAQLKAKDDWTTIVERNEAAAPEQQQPLQVVPELRGFDGWVELVRYWLARANSAYRNQIVSPLRTPYGAPAPAADTPPHVAASASAPSAPARIDENRGRLQEAEEAIKRQAEAADELRRETEKAAAAKLADAVNAEARTAEDKRIAAAAEERRKAQAAEQKRVSEAKRQADEAEAKRIAEEAAAKRKAEEAEVKRVAEAEAEANRKAEEDSKRAAAEADAAEHRAVAEAEAQAKRQAEIDAEATRRMQAAASAKGTSRAEPVPAAVTAAGPVTGPVPPFPAAVRQESSDIAIAPAVPEKKPDAPEKGAKVVAKSRDEAVGEAVEQSVKPPRKLKAAAAKRSGTGKHAHAKKSKRHVVYKHATRKHGKAHLGKRRWSAGAIVIGRHCDCRCGRVLLKPRKYRSAGRVVHVRRHQVSRRHRAVPHKAHRARVTYRHRLHYID